MFFAKYAPRVHESSIIEGATSDEHGYYDRPLRSCTDCDFVYS